MMHRVFCFSLFVLFMAAAGSLANADGVSTFTFTNNTGQNANDLHVELSAAATIVNKVKDPVTGVETVGGVFPKWNGEGATSQDYSGATVAPAGTVVVQYKTTGTPAEIKSWYWTKDGKKIRNEKVDKDGNPLVAGTDRRSTLVEAEVAQGLLTATLDSLHGKVTVRLPDDTRPGDTISGTVLTEPAGQTEQERRANADTLNGYVIQLENESSPTSGLDFTWTIPAVASGGGILILKDPAGSVVSRTQTPVILRTSPRPPMKDFLLPEIGQTGKPIAIPGPFDGDFANTHVTIGGAPVNKLAESAGKFIVESPPNVVGPTQITLKEGNSEKTGPYRSVAILLSAPKTTLNRGETTTLSIRVDGLKNLTKAVEIQIENTSPDTIRMEKGDLQRIAIRPRDVSTDGTYRVTYTLTGVRPGSFAISASMVSR